MKYNINNLIEVFPNELGWSYIKTQLLTTYGSSFKDYKDYEQFLEHRVTKDGGYREQLHEIASIFPKLFCVGTDYLKTTDINLEE